MAFKCPSSSLKIYAHMCTHAHMHTRTHPYTQGPLLEVAVQTLALTANLEGIKIEDFPQCWSSFPHCLGQPRAGYQSPVQQWLADGWAVPRPAFHLPEDHRVQRRRVRSMAPHPSQKHLLFLPHPRFLSPHTMGSSERRRTLKDNWGNLNKV